MHVVKSFVEILEKGIDNFYERTQTSWFFSKEESVLTIVKIILKYLLSLSDVVISDVLLLETFPERLLQ